MKLCLVPDSSLFLAILNFFCFFFQDEKNSQEKLCFGSNFMLSRPTRGSIEVIWRDFRSSNLKKKFKFIKNFQILQNSQNM